ncbi:MAG: cell surface protein SprA [Calditrichaeota bacterium]|nr:MAG: cell surface protein SprA [Calditrichota bacterium]
MVSNNRKISILIFVVSVILFTPDLVWSKIGFELGLDTRPLLVTDYREQSEEFTAAIYPVSYPFLSRQLEFKPQPVASSFEENSIRFETEFYRRGRDKYKLIPVSVDANKYYSYRARQNYIKKLSESFSKAISTQNDRKGNRGLGVQVALPKRLEKIFGEGSAGLNVSGYKRVEFAGQSRWNDAATTTNQQQSKFPTLKMDQVDRFEITGNVGSKITVRVTQDSQTDLPLANRIQIRYKGDDDDILKSIEAGNTNLSLPRTKFVGYSSQINGLFGIKAEAQVGALSLTAIASQEKGSSEQSSFNAGGEENPEYIRDYQYENRRVYHLGLPADTIGNTIYPADLLPNDRITKLYVYENVQSYNNDQAGNTSLATANFYVDPNNPDQFQTENVIGEGFTQVQQMNAELYTFFNDTTRGLHYIVFNNSISGSKTIGYYMEVDRADGSKLIFGNLEVPVDSGQAPLYHLKLLAKSELGSDYNPTNRTWDLMWRNAYRIPTGSTLEELKIKVFKGLVGSEGRSSSLDYQSDGSGNNTSYLEILGLDTENSNSNTDIPDGVVDDKRTIYRPELGLIFFPDPQPFDSDTTFIVNGVETPQLAKKNENIYDFRSISEKNENSQYYIQMITVTRGSIISLNRANIIENSERITINGKELQRGVDYQIQYDFGQVTLLSDAASDPNADIKIDYEYAPFFAVQKKTLLGMRAEYELSKDLQFGTTFLYKSDKAQERKPKVGQETAKTIVFDADLSLKLYPSFFTKAIDALPLISTEAQSVMTISGEVAQSYPNPNVEGDAYVDDFEAALDNLSLGTSRVSWRHSSAPVPVEEDFYSKGKMIWHRPVWSVPVDSVYTRETEVGGGSMRIFRMIFRPQYVDSTYNEADSSITVETTTKSWGGIMKFFNNRVDENRAQLFEVRMRHNMSGKNVKLHFDFGKINEDINNNGLRDFEGVQGKEFLDEDEDTGLDLLLDEDEQPGFYDPINNPDPNGDNWYSFSDGEGKCPIPGGCPEIDDSDPRFYDYLNGTEGNYFDNQDGDLESASITFNKANEYFSYVLDFADDSSRFEVENSRLQGWITYRIPIRDPDALDAIITEGAGDSAQWNQISQIRVWVETDETVTEPIEIQIADWYFVQMNWQDTVLYSPLSDLKTKFVASSISDDVSTDFYTAPGVSAYEDPTTSITEVQKALELTFTELNRYDTVMATKNLLTVDRYSGYRTMEMYIWGDTDPDKADDIASAEFFFRIGRDENNYYEYHSSIKPGWDESNHMKFNFIEATALKDSAQQLLDKGFDVNVRNEKYAVLGNPNLNEIQYFAAGVINKDSSDISGRIWLDELRVTDVRKDVGTAGRISVTGNMADFLSYNFSLQSQDPYFRGISAATRGGSENNLGSGRQVTSITSSLTLQLQKLLPRSWGAALPVTMGYSKQVTTPLLRNNSDIELPVELQKKEQSINISKSLSVSASFNQKNSKNPLFSLILNRLRTRFSYRQNNQKTVTYPYSFGENVDVSADYNLGVKTPPTLPIFFWMKSIPIFKKASESRLSLYPTRWSVNGRFNRSLTLQDDVNNKRRTSVKRSFSGGMDVSYDVFQNLSTSLNYSTSHDMTDLDLVNISFGNLKLGQQLTYSQRFSSSYDPSLLGFLSSSFSFKSNYKDDWERSTDSKRSTMSKSYSVGGRFQHQVLLGGKGSSANDRRFRGRRGQGRRRNVEEEKAEEKEKGKAFYTPVIDGLRKVTSWIDPISYSYSYNYSNYLPGMVDRPSVSYRFGFHDNTSVSRIDDSRSQKSSESNSYELSTGFTLLGGIATTIKFRESKSRDIVNISRRTEDINRSWPDLTIRISEFKTFPLIKEYLNKFIRVFTPRTGYSRSTKKTSDLDDGLPIGESIDVSYNPLLGVNFKVLRSLSLSGSIGRSESERIGYNALSGARESSTLNTKQTIQFSTKYSFSSPQGISIPILGKLKFNSVVDMKVDFKMNKTTIEDLEINEITSEKNDFSVSPVIGYSFSQQIKGGITLVWRDSKDQKITNYYREVKLWTEIRF